MLVAAATPNIGVVKFIFVPAIPEGNVLLILGTPPALVTRTPLFAVASPLTVEPFAAYHASWFCDPEVTIPEAVAVVASVPLVGNVTLVAPVIVNTDAKAPDVARVPASVKVLEPLLTPVPP